MYEKLKERYNEIVSMRDKAKDLGLEQSYEIYNAKAEAFYEACMIMNIDLDEK